MGDGARERSSKYFQGSSPVGARYPLFPGSISTRMPEDDHLPSDDPTDDSRRLGWIFGRWELDRYCEAIYARRGE